MVNAMMSEKAKHLMNDMQVMEEKLRLKRLTFLRDIGTNTTVVRRNHVGDEDMTRSC